MSEQSITVVLCEDAMCTVFYDYTHYEPATLEDPECLSDVTINSVEVEGQDILLALSDEIVECLRIECFEATEGEEE